MQEFDYFECGICEFSSVQKREFTGSIWCPLCFEDNGRDVAMRRRKAYETDKAEGFDARKES